MNLKLWLLLGAFAAFWVVAVYVYLRIVWKVRDGNLAALHSSAISLYTPVTTVPGSFACPHMTVGGVLGASCGHCGPLARVA